MNQVQLVVESRVDTGKSPSRKLRREGLVPGIVYGLDGVCEQVSVPARALQHILQAAGGSNTLIELKVGDRSQLTLAREVQRHPVRGTVLHVDFIRVLAGQSIEAEVPVNLIGESLGARDGGRLEQIVFHVKVAAPAGSIPSGIDHDVTALGMGDQLLVSELAVPAGATIVTDGDVLVAHLPIPRGAGTGPAVAADDEAEAE
jgi:large subunit ribosomal protein L25